MARTRHASDFTVDELRQYVRRARASTVRRLLDEELASDIPRAGAVELLEARLEALGGLVGREAVAPAEVPVEAEPVMGAAAGPASGPPVAAPRDLSTRQEEAPEPPNQTAERAGGRAQRAGDQAQDVVGQARERTRLLQDLADRARRQPVAVVAIGLAIGFALSRTIKAARGGGGESEAEYAAAAETKRSSSPRLRLTCVSRFRRGLLPPMSAAL